MKFAVDRIEDDIVVLENIETNELREIDRTLLPSSIHEGAILVFADNTYILDNDEEEKRRKMIEERFMRLRNNT